MSESAPEAAGKATPAPAEGAPAEAADREAARRAAREAARQAKARATRVAAESDLLAAADTDPVARVLVDVPLAHLDRPFDYLVPRQMGDIAVPGARVKVRFAGQEVGGFVVERVDASAHPGRLTPLRRAVSREPVLSPEVARLCAEVAERYAGTRSDVLRLAVPARHAAVEKQDTPQVPEAVIDLAVGERVWSAYSGGQDFLRDLARGGSPRQVWSALPDQRWPMSLATAAAATYASGRGAVICLPDGRDVARVDAALTALLGAGRHVLLTADLGPARRYRAFLALSRGAVRIVLGTRAAAFAPVHRLGLVAVWDDGDDSHAEPRAPYPHAREVLLLRAHEESCAALVGGHARSVEAEQLLTSGWAGELVAERSTVRAASAQIDIPGASDHTLARDPFARSSRLPRSAFEGIREALESGPVLVQTPRQGYVTTLACQSCRAAARCPTCTGPLAVSAPHLPPTCRWCGEQVRAWSCAECGGRELRAPVRGDARTAEEIGRAFPAVPVRTSSGDRVLTAVGPEPAIVVATPGAEPLAEGGYRCVVLLDTSLMLARADLRTGEESLRRWLNAAALARPRGADGRVVAVGESDEPTLQALLRWDPAGFARRELAERTSAHLPPVARLATVTGEPPAVESALAMLELPTWAEVLGPVPVEPEAWRGPRAVPTVDSPEPVRAVVRVPRSSGALLSRALLRMQGLRSARKLPAVRVQVDPVSLG